MTAKVSPFIVWTLQRTGGTNLTSRLIELSGLPTTEHEPFNSGRKFGAVSQQWIEGKDRASLASAMKNIVASGVVIKHCVEMVPWEVTEELAAASVEAGYRHLFLYRRNALDRLLSLHFAKQTGIWGPDEQQSRPQPDGQVAGPDSAKEDNVDTVLERSLPVEDLIRHERRCVELLTHTWDALRATGAAPLALAYEDIYGATDPEQPARLIAPVLAALGLEQDEASLKAWVREVIGKGDQGTRDKYSLFPGVSELGRRLRSVVPFSPESGSGRLNWRGLSNAHPWIERFFVDVVPEWVEAGQRFDVGGVLVLSTAAPDGLELRLASRDGTQALNWGEPSQRMALECPQGKNAARARWLGTAAFAEGQQNIVINLVAADGAQVPLCELFRVSPANYAEIHREPDDRLIFDIGANDGADTWYYLRKGFRVVAVEAIPDLANRLRDTFATQIAEQRLAIDQKAVTAVPGDVEITINEERTEWSSAHHASKAFAGKHRTISVPGVTLAELINHYGSPYYIKIDIEGGELDAVSSLREIPMDRLPDYISIEKNPQVFDVLQVLWDLGYREFQLVRQGVAYLPAPPTPSHEGLDYRCAFSSNMSGPFGRDLPESNWVGLVEILRRLVVLPQGTNDRVAQGDNSGWYDIHANKLRSRRARVE